MSSLDRSLDDIISAKKASLQKNRLRGSARGRLGPRRGLPGRKIVTTPRVASTNKQAAIPTLNVTDKKKFEAKGGLVINNSAGGTSVIEGSKIVVSNLPEDVTEAQVKELFQTTVGQVKSVFITYNSKGNSTGVATVEFKSVADGTKAYNQYNKRLIDQSR